MCLLQVEHDFILQAERETFIEQRKDVMDKAEDMLSEDTDVDHGSDPGASPPPLSTGNPGAGEVSRDARFREGQALPMPQLQALRTTLGHCLVTGRACRVCSVG